MSSKNLFNNLPADITRMIASTVGSDESSSDNPYPELNDLGLTAITADAIKKDGGLEHVVVKHANALDDDEVKDGEVKDGEEKDEVAGLIGLRTATLTFNDIPKTVTERLLKCFKRVEHLRLDIGDEKHTGLNLKNVEEFLALFPNITSLYYCWQTDVNWDKVNFPKLKNVVEIYYTFMQSAESMRKCSNFVKRHKPRVVHVGLVAPLRPVVNEMTLGVVYDGLPDERTGEIRRSPEIMSSSIGSIHNAVYAFENLPDLKEFVITAFIKNDNEIDKKYYEEFGDNIGDFDSSKPIDKVDDSRDSITFEEFGNIPHTFEGGNINTRITLPNDIRFILKGRINSKVIARRV